MGNIVSLKSINNEKVEVKLEVTQKEMLWLKGNLDKMYLFSENNLDMETRLVQRGKRESTKYFLMPKEFRKNILISNSVKCTMIDSKTKQFFIFAVNKY